MIRPLPLLVLLAACHHPPPLAFIPVGATTPASCAPATTDAIEWTSTSEDYCPVFAAVSVTDPVQTDRARRSLAQIRGRAIALECDRAITDTSGSLRCDVAVALPDEPTCRALTAGVTVALAAARRATLQLSVACGAAVDHASYDAALGLVVVSTSTLGEHRFRLMVSGPTRPAP